VRSNDPREQLEAEHAATIGWLFDSNEEKLGRQTDALVAGDPDRREVEGRPPLSLGLPSSRSGSATMPIPSTRAVGEFERAPRIPDRVGRLPPPTRRRSA
jgi:hypothetical protein